MKIILLDDGLQELITNTWRIFVQSSKQQQDN